MTDASEARPRRRKRASTLAADRRRWRQRYAHLTLAQLCQRLFPD